MNATNMANVYKNQQIMTAAPEELTLMLYNGAIRFVSESIQELDKHNLAKSHSANLRAQDIIREFICTLDMQYDISKGLFSLYDYIQFRLIQANVKKDKSQLEEARNLLVELRDTWAEAMKLARGARAMAR
jgi:flagellar protein FliS